jgi:hypothetical protein
VQPAVLTLEMHGRTVRTPLVSEAPRPAQLMARRPGELVEHLFEVETVEAIDSQPWLTGMKADHPEARVELVGVHVIRENTAAETVGRLYELLLLVPAPADEKQVLAFSLTEQGTGPSVGLVQPYHVRVSYAPPVRAVPQQLLLAIDDDTQFPLTRTLELVPTDDEQVVTISDLSVGSEWLTAEVLAEPADTAATSEGPGRLRISVHVEEMPAEPGPTGRQSELFISLEAPEHQPIRVPVILVDGRSLIASTPDDR